MFDPEKILKRLVRQGLSQGFGYDKKHYKKRRYSSDSRYQSPGALGGLSKATLGMGMLGVAIAAYEHFTAQGAQTAPPSPQPSPSGTQHSSMPPPPPPPATQPPANHSAPASASGGVAELLVRAMVAAAASDGTIDEHERRTILSRVADDGLTPHEQRFLADLFAAPPTLDDIVSRVPDLDIASQVYGASLIAISVDSDAERRYLSQLADALRIPPERVAEWNDVLGFSKE